MDAGLEPLRGQTGNRPPAFSDGRLAYPPGRWRGLWGRCPWTTATVIAFFHASEESMFRYALGASVLLPIVCFGFALSAGESRFAQTGSRSQYTHWIDLYDASRRRIDPTDPKAPPYSPRRTCGSCHDYEAISLGHHFNAIQNSTKPGRPGEPWIWTDTRTGTQIPLSYRGWPGTYEPGALGISTWDFVLKFGRHLPGGGPGEQASEAAAAKEAAPKEPATKEAPRHRPTRRSRLPRARRRPLRGAGRCPANSRSIA